MYLQSLGKTSVAKRQASVYGLAFLGVFYTVFIGNLLVLVGLTLTCGHQVAQAAVDVGAPGVRADTVALIGGDETYVREANFCLVALLGDFKDNVGVLPLALVIYEVKVVVHNAPNNLFTWNKFGDFEGTAVNVLVVVLKFTEFVGPALNFF